MRIDKDHTIPRPVLPGKQQKKKDILSSDVLFIMFDVQADCVYSQ